MKKRNILFVDDDPEMRKLVQEFFRPEEYSVMAAVNGVDAVSQISASDFDCVVTDLRMAEMDGLTLLKKIHSEKPQLPIVLITAFGSVETAVEAMKEGASNFIPKPFKMQTLKTIVDKAVAQKWMADENRFLKTELEEKYSYHSLIGKSKSMQKVYELISQVASTHSNVLIEGESGTGKELVARALHYNGALSKFPFVAINCSALPENLLESELFGYVKGAFTDAKTSKKGLFEVADGGTLFLDEISSMPMGLQAKILRALQEGEIRPLGHTQDRKVDVRIISATNKDLEKEVEEDTFREDLYYRLNVIRIVLPPLRERQEDIPLLAHHFLNRYCGLNKKKIAGFEPDAMAFLVNAPWKGNVRELENAVERAVVLSKGETISAAEVIPQARAMKKTGKQDFGGAFVPLKEMESIYINRVLESVGGNKEKAAKILGISSRTLYRMPAKTS